MEEIIKLHFIDDLKFFKKIELLGETYVLLPLNYLQNLSEIFSVPQYQLRIFFS